MRLRALRKQEAPARNGGRFIPEPVSGRRAPQSNDVALDDRGLIYLVDRNIGFDILEFSATA